MVRARAPVALAVSLVTSGCIAYHELPLPSPTSARPVPAALPGLRAGFGRADITPPPGVGLAGNGPEGRRAAGYRVRLYGRALLLEDRTGERVAFVVADLAQVTPNLQRLTAERIRDSTGIGADRLVIAATHVHSGPGHFYAERQYNQSTSQVVGYDSAMVEFLVSRLARAVLDAQRDLRLARVAWSATAVWGHTRNRSYQAFLRNKPEWTPPAPVAPGLDATHRAVNPLWTLLRVDQRGRGADSAYRPAGALSVFAVHGTADAPENELLDAGIHGIVERGLERHVDSLSRRGAGYHLVANGAEGDVSPDWPVQSRCGAPTLRPVVGPGGPRTPPPPWEWRDPAPAWMGLCRAAARRYVNTAGDSLAARAAALFDSLGPGLRGDLRVGAHVRRGGARAARGRSALGGPPGRSAAGRRPGRGHDAGRRPDGARHRRERRRRGARAPGRDHRGARQRLHAVRHDRRGIRGAGLRGRVHAVWTQHRRRACGRAGEARRLAGALGSESGESGRLARRLSRSVPHHSAAAHRRTARRASRACRAESGLRGRHARRAVAGSLPGTPGPGGRAGAADRASRGRAVERGGVGRRPRARGPCRAPARRPGL